MRLWYDDDAAHRRMTAREAMDRIDLALIMVICAIVLAALLVTRGM